MKYTAPDGAVGDRFGRFVEVSGDVAIAGATWDDDHGDTSGSAYVFNLATGQLIRKITPSDGQAGDQFGWTVAIDGNLAMMGAILDDDRGAESGSAYLFNWATGQQLFKFTAFDGAANDLFGAHVAIDNGMALVGAYQDDDKGVDSGSVYVFSASTGQFIRKNTGSAGSGGAFFGGVVAADGGTALIGASHDSVFGANQGAAYLFDLSSGQKLYSLGASADEVDEGFGTSVAIDSGRALVGARLEDSAGSDSGAAYLFDVATGQQLFRLIANDAAAGDRFGTYVAIYHGIAVVGAPGDDDYGEGSGAAYLFDVATGQQIAKLTPPDGAMMDAFGEYVAIDHRTVLVGASLDDDKGENSGSFYAYTIVPEPGALCLTATAIAGFNSGRRRRAGRRESGQRFGRGISNQLASAQQTACRRRGASRLAA